MSTYQLAYLIAQDVLKKGTLDINQLRKTWTPYALGAIYEGRKLPSEIICSSPNAKLFIQSMHLKTTGIPEFIECMRWLRDDMHYSIDSNVSYRGLETLFRLHNVHYHTHLIPVPLVHNEGTGAPAVTIHMMSWTEYMNTFNMFDVSAFFNHIVQYVLFGFPLTDYFCNDVMQLDNVDDYYASRLFQGLGDIGTMIQAGRSTDVSSFMMEPLATDPPDFTSTMNRLSTVMNRGPYKKQKVDISIQANSVRNQVLNGHYVGFNSEAVLAILRAKLFSVEEQYEAYLAQPNPFQKVSYALWKSIVYAGKDQQQTQQQTTVTWGADQGAWGASNYTECEPNPFIVL